MQYTLLWIVAIIVILILIGKYIYSGKLKKNYSKREDFDLLKYLNNNYDKRMREVFIRLWCDLGEMVNIKKEKIYPDDRIGELEKLSQFPEYFYEDLEETFDFSNIKDESLKNIDKISVIELFELLTYMDNDD